MTYGRLPCLALLAFSVLPACDHPAPAAVATPAAPVAPAPVAAAPTSPGHFGGALSSAAALPVSAVLADPARFDGQTVKLSGQVGAVCQRKGCWMTLGTGQPGEPTMRVTFKDYGFFVPRESLGHKATVEGLFAVKALSVAQAQHYAEDAVKPGDKPMDKPAMSAPTKPQMTLALVASGVDLL